MAQATIRLRKLAGKLTTIVDGSFQVPFHRSPRVTCQHVASNVLCEGGPIAKGGLRGRREAKNHPKPGRSSKIGVTSSSLLEAWSRGMRWGGGGEQACITHFWVDFE